MLAARWPTIGIGQTLCVFCNVD